MTARWVTYTTSHEVAKLMRRAELEGATYYQRTDRTLGDLGAGASPARHLVAERVALPSSPPFFDPRPHLEAAGASRAAAIYHDPALGELPSSAESSQRSELRRCCLFSVGGEGVGQRLTLGLSSCITHCQTTPSKRHHWQSPVPAPPANQVPGIVRMHLHPTSLTAD